MKQYVRNPKKVFYIRFSSALVQISPLRLIFIACRFFSSFFNIPAVIVLTSFLLIIVITVSSTFRHSSFILPRIVTRLAISPIDSLNQPFLNRFYSSYTNTYLILYSNVIVE